MDREQLNVRIPKDLADKLDRESENTGRSKTWIVIAAVSDYLGIPHEAKDIEALHKRVKALESKFESLREKPAKKTEDAGDSRTESEDYGELITLQEAIELTGYAESSLRSNFSRKGITAKEQKGGNRTGKYSKKEILEKIGYK